MKTLKRILAVGLPEQEIYYLRKNMEHDSEIKLYAVQIMEDWEEQTDTSENTIAKLRESGLVISGKEAVLSWAKEQKIASIAYRDGTADMIVEGFEEVGTQFLVRSFERYHNIPWKILETKRCIVRELELGDIDALFELYSDPKMTEYMENLFPYKKEIEYQKAYIENMYRFYGYGMWLVFEKASGKLIGRAGVEHREELGGELELGYAIGTDFWHQGYATEVCRAILDYVKEELYFEEVSCLIESGNKVSVNFAKKLGFQYQILLNIGGKKMLKYVLKL